MESGRQLSNQIGVRLKRLVGRIAGRDKTAFVLSGGGNLGAVQVGMLRALVDAGIVPDMIVGSSVGAINGAGFAAEPSGKGVDRLDRIWRRIANGDPDLMPTRRLPLAVQFARKANSLHDPGRLGGLLTEELAVSKFEDLPVPFSCVATDVDAAEEYWFDSGDIVKALLASSALPAVYPPVKVVGKTLIDGGVLNEIPTSRAVELGATEIYILHVGHLEGRTYSVQRPFDAAIHAYWTARRHRLEEDIRSISETCRVFRLPAGSMPRLRFDDFTQGPELSKLAYTASSEFLNTGESPEPVSVTSEASEEDADADSFLEL